jgi:hypothetical protein
MTIALWIAAYLLAASSLGSLVGRRLKAVNAYQITNPTRSGPPPR